MPNLVISAYPVSISTSNTGQVTLFESLDGITPQIRISLVVLIALLIGRSLLVESLPNFVSRIF